MTARVLLGCERSGRVRREFRRLGFDAWSCDLEPADDGDPHHIQADVLTVLDRGWDLAIFFPPCTHTAVSGARWFAEKQKDGRQQAAIEFFLRLARCEIPRRALEQPVSIMSRVYRKPDQIIQPWMFGHGETKTTCLWLEGDLPPLVPTEIVAGREARIHRMAPSPERARLRSETYQGIADAMADQWGRLLVRAEAA